MNLAFSVAKSGLSIVPTLVHPDTSAKVSLSVDASSSHIRAVLQQDVAGSWAPLAFYSKKLSSTQSRYSAIDLLFKSSPPWSAMQQSSLSFLSEFNCDIIHLPGAQNMIADALSCPTWVLWKRLNTETSQCGNASKTGFEEFPFFWEIPQNWKMLRDFRIFLRRFLIFKVEVFPLFF